MDAISQLHDHPGPLPLPKRLARLRPELVGLGLQRGKPPGLFTAPLKAGGKLEGSNLQLDLSVCASQMM